MTEEPVTGAVDGFGICLACLSFPSMDRVRVRAILVRFVEILMQFNSEVMQDLGNLNDNS